MEKNTDRNRSTTRVDGNDPAPGADVKLWLPGDLVWWMRDTQFGTQRIAAVVFCRLPKKVRITVSILGDTHTRDVPLQKLKARCTNEDPDNKREMDLEAVQMAKNRNRINRSRYDTKPKKWETME